MEGSFYLSPPMNNECIFCKIIAKEIPAKIIFENDACLAFHDINPRAKIHVLIIPKKHIATVNDLTADDKENMGEMLLAAKTVAEKLDMKSYKLLVSVGKEAGQEIFHLHMHVMSPN
jgi:histidine triad (HIT) family protein